MKTLFGKAMCATVLVAMTVLAGGCQQEITGERVRSDISPELQSLTLTEQQRQNQIARTVDTNLRQLINDFDELLLLDRPARLSRWPVP